MTFDLLENSVQSVVKSFSLFQLMESLRLHRFIIANKVRSYCVPTDTGIEQFEKVMVRRYPVSIAVRVYENVSDWFTTALVVCLISILIGFIIWLF